MRFKNETSDSDSPRVPDERPGHPVLNPDGREIRIPAWAMQELRQAGLLKKNRERGLWQIKPEIHLFLSESTLFFANVAPRRSAPSHAPRHYLEGRGSSSGSRLINLLGKDLSGPAIVSCNCEECRLLPVKKGQ